MKKTIFIFSIIATSISFAQTNDKSKIDNCFTKLENAFQKRGSYTVGDDVHTNVIISFIEGDNATCVEGKVRVENGVITSIFFKYEDDNYKFFDKKFTNTKRMAPTITNGISELIIAENGDKMRVVFIDKLKPKETPLKQAKLPDDL